MKMKLLITSGFLMHAVLGNFCMMSMVHAADMPMLPESHKSMSMGMTHESPECEHCGHEEKQKHNPESQKSPCDNGHCLSQSASASTTTGFTFNGLTIAISASAVVFNYPVQELSFRPTSHAPPNPPISTKTVVLRF